jgi:hypothetical protein
MPAVQTTKKERKESERQSTECGIILFANHISDKDLYLAYIKNA